MKTIILPDIHLKWRIAQLIIDNVPHNRVVFLGDAFDMYGDSPFENADMAKWLEKFLSDENHVALLGNHDMAYKYPGYTTRCSGFTQSKLKEIQKSIDPAIWNKTKLFHVEQGYLCTHAGFSFPLYRWMTGNENSNSIEAVETFLTHTCNDARTAMELDHNHQIIGVGYMRGGSQVIGGINWCDFSEFKPIPHVNQIFGHTPQPEPKVNFLRRKESKDDETYKQTVFYSKFVNDDKMISVNYAIDTGLRYYGIIEDGKFSIHKVLHRTGRGGELIWIDNE